MLEGLGIVRVVELGLVIGGIEAGLWTVVRWRGCCSAKTRIWSIAGLLNGRFEGSLAVFVGLSSVFWVAAERDVSARNVDKVNAPVLRLHSVMARNNSSSLSRPDSYIVSSHDFFVRLGAVLGTVTPMTHFG